MTATSKKQPLGLNDLRALFRDFYVSKGHHAAESFSLVPEHDKSLLLINSGMAPLKPYFSGEKTPPAPRMTTCQKCVRTADLENVGKTARHASFFEMLGSFSFGDYFKSESIRWGYEFVRDGLKLPMDRIWVSVYEEDDEAYDIWAEEIDFPKERIVRLGKEDNFWEIGVGPCGPCSEIYYDLGEEYGCGAADCKPGCDCDRFTEFWNHVFTQFNRKEDGSYEPLTKKNIDTGLGLERLACIVQGVDSIFDVDTIRPIVDEISRASGKPYGTGSEDTDMSIRVIADHIRAAVFMISDGILPGSEERSYVLRKLLRRAIVHCKKLGIDKPFLHELADKTIELSYEAYKNLSDGRERITQEIEVEERAFAKTLKAGMEMLQGELAELAKVEGSTVFSGAAAFKLYDTYGFPIDLTVEILAENGTEVDMDGFEHALAEQKSRSKADHARKKTGGWVDDNEILSSFSETKFIGYDNLETEAKVLGVLGEDGEKIVFDKTPFYAEMGGQVSDKGEISVEGESFHVDDVENVNGVYLHHVSNENKKDLTGKILAGSLAKLTVDRSRRNRISANHSATHILHSAMRRILGEHVEQAGSMVGEDFFRFDFKHKEKVSTDALDKIEALVNEWISYNEPVTTMEMSQEEARGIGAMALFGEKYGEVVRVVRMGEEAAPISIEFCGGTHVGSVGLIGGFAITSEAGVSSGIRRIEGVTGITAAAMLSEKIAIGKTLAKTLKTSVDMVPPRVEKLLAQIYDLKKELKEEKSSGGGSGAKLAKEIFDKAKDIENSGGSAAGARAIFEAVSGKTVPELRELTDALLNMAHADGSVKLLTALVSNDAEKPVMIIGVSEALIAGGVFAGDMTKELMTAGLGKGGGKKNIAQFGLAGESAAAKAYDIMKSKVAEGGK